MTWNISSSHIILILLVLIRLNTRAGLVFAIANIRFNDVDGINLNGGIVEDTSTRKLLNNKMFKSNYKLSSKRADDNLAFINSSCDDMMSSDLTVVKKDKSKRNGPSRTAPFCIVDENGFRCDSTNQNSWRINSDNGLTFSDLEFEGEVCQIFIPPNNPNEATLLIELMVNSSFGTLYLPNITGTWERPFDFLGNCKQPFFCDTSINGGITSSKAVTNGTCRLKFSRATPCFSANQCDTHRCTGDFQQSDKGPLVTNETVVTPNGQPILSNEICAALGDLQRPLISQPLDTPTDTATSTPEIILLSVLGTGTNSDDSLRNISLSARKGVLNLFSTNKNENFSTTSRQVDFKGSKPNSSEAAIALISPVPAIKRSSLFSNSNELYNNESEIDLVSNYSNRTSLDSSNTRGSNVGSIGIINMTNVGIGRSNDNLSVQNPLEVFKLARVPSQTARIFNPDSYFQLQQNQNMFTLPEKNIKEQFTEASEEDKKIKQFTEASEKDKKIRTQLEKIEDEITRENALNATLELEDMVIVKDPNKEILEEKERQERRQKKLEMLYNQQFKGSSNV
ncbi:23789_t:CDS:2 [Cetraspora pellucida]|uniref:23789_t:CDS:1 n=1 Tax=Cetraspora pellucida TaxID=1433469 RepID=A0A9N8VGT9_9GLOM|nr:23789_t:CDS:2 [Cetraspora pellucida]